MSLPAIPTLTLLEVLLVDGSVMFRIFGFWIWGLGFRAFGLLGLITSVLYDFTRVVDL